MGQKRSSSSSARWPWMLRLPGWMAGTPEMTTGRQTVGNIIRNPVYAGELHGVKKAQPAIVSRRAWNEAQR